MYCTEAKGSSDSCPSEARCQTLPALQRFGLKRSSALPTSRYSSTVRSASTLLYVSWLRLFDTRRGERGNRSYHDSTRLNGWSSLNRHCAGHSDNEPKLSIEKLLCLALSSLRLPVLRSTRVAGTRSGRCGLWLWQPIGSALHHPCLSLYSRPDPPSADAAAKMVHNETRLRCSQYMREQAAAWRKINLAGRVDALIPVHTAYE